MLILKPMGKTKNYKGKNSSKDIDKNRPKPSH